MFLKETISYALQQKRIDFDKTKTQFFNKKRKVQLGRMRFKKKGTSRDSFRIPGQAVGFNSGIDFESDTVKVPKLGKIKFRKDREFKGSDPKLLSITISRDNVGRYFASVLVQENISLNRVTPGAVGIDLGVKDLMTLFFGNTSTKISNPRHFRENQSKLALAQRHLSRKTRGSNRYNKQRLKVARIQRKIADQRSDFTHKLTSFLTRNFGIICLEDLDVNSMKTNLGKSISDASFSELVRQLKYKADWNNTTITQVDRYFPSTKMCSSCGSIHELSLSDRSWVCECGITHDRDTNAAKNILREGLRTLDLSVETTDYSRGKEIEELLTNINSFNDISNKRLENY